MKKASITIAIILSPLYIVFAQNQTLDLSKTILVKDSLFWQAYNNCDVDAMSLFFAEDVEFYHDKGGMTEGLNNLRSAIQKGLCGNEHSRLRRVASEETVKVFPMQNSNVTYGAIISGEHVFYIVETGKEPRLDGKARFTHLWLLSDGEWKMARVLSYDHGPAGFLNKRKQLRTESKLLTKYTGKYNAPKSGVAEVKLGGDQLSLTVAGQRFELFCESKTTFSVKERDITFEFVEDEKGNVVRILVREKGNIVETFMKL